MKQTKGAQTVQTIPGRRVVVSSAVGTTNVEELKWLTQTVLANAVAWKGTGWAYVADCSKMTPIGPNEVPVLVEMTKKFADAGCKAIGFAEGNSIMLKAQTKTNTKMSNTGLIEGHFGTVDEVLAWLQKDMHI